MSQSAFPAEPDLAEALAGAVNVGVKSDLLAAAVADEHRYLQNQIFFEVVKPLIISYAQREQYDARNEPAVEECRTIAEQMNWIAE